MVLLNPRVIAVNQDKLGIAGSYKFTYMSAHVILNFLNKLWEQD